MYNLISKRKALKAVSFDTEAYTAINMLPEEPDRELIEEYMRKIKERISPHTSADGVAAINYYLELIYDQIYGEDII